MLDRPIASQPHYGDHLGDSDYWGPYVIEVLRREALPLARVEAPLVGSFPTFLVGDCVVKLFGSGFDGPGAWAAERSMHELLADRPEIPAPTLVTVGVLFDGDEWKWPYLVTRRLRTQPVRDASLADAQGAAIAGQLGEAVAALHTLEPPAAVAVRDLVPDLRAAAQARLARFGVPPHLVEQVPEFLSDALAPTTLVHADITADHLFHDGHMITGIIDWGDAIVADAYYELVAITFDCFDGDPKLLGAFLRSYGWVIENDFPKRAMQAVCEFQFNAWTRIASIVDLNAEPTLDHLSDRLFGAVLH